MKSESALCVIRLQPDFKEKRMENKPLSKSPSSKHKVMCRPLPLRSGDFLKLPLILRRCKDKNKILITQAKSLKKSESTENLTKMHLLS